jgi:hypothetical protein
VPNRDIDLAPLDTETRVLSTTATLSDDGRRVVIHVYDERRGPGSSPVFEAVFDLPPPPKRIACAACSGRGRFGKAPEQYVCLACNGKRTVTGG